jgi:ParB/RepB/Spo0J family partition protein
MRTDPTAPAGEGVWTDQLPVDLIVPATDNPRRDLGDLAELTASIQAHGVLEPLLVTPGASRGHGAAWLLVCGARRHAAARAAGLARVPCIIREFTEPERLATMLVENVQRRSLTPLEEAHAYARLLQVDPDLTQRDLARLTGVSQRTVSARLALLELPTQTIGALDTSRITLAQAEALHKLVDLGATEQAAELTRQHLAGELPAWGSFEEQVTTAVDRARAARRAEHSLQELQARKARVFSKPKDGWYSRQPRPLHGQEHGRCIAWEHVQVDVDAHADQGCHAAAVCEGHGEIVWLCNDPKRHTSEDDRERYQRREAWEREHAEQDAQQRADQRALTTAAKVRASVVRELLGQGVGADAGQYPPNQLLHDLVRTLLERLHVDVAKVACELLELDPVPMPQYGANYKDWRQPLEDLAAADQLDRLGHALVLAAAEHHLRGHWLGWTGELPRRYFNRLRRAGYQLAEVERRKLEQAATEASAASDDQDLDGAAEDGSWDRGDDDQDLEDQRLPEGGP